MPSTIVRGLSEKFLDSLSITEQEQLKVLFRFKRAGYSSDIIRQTACQVFNPIMVEGYAALFHFTAVVQASDSMTASM